MADIKLKIKVDGKELDAVLDDAGGQFNSIHKQAKGVRGTLSEWGNIITGFNQGLQAIKSVYNFISKPIDLAAQFEGYLATLKVMLGDEKLAKDRLKELFDFAATTPFEVPQVIEAGNQLQALGLYSKKTLTDLGDLAAASGKPLEQVLSAFAKLASGQKGIAIDMFRDLLITSEDWSKATKKEIGANGQLQASVEEMAAALPEIIREKGFAGMMNEQSKITKGMQSNFQDMITQTLAGLGDNLLPMYKDTLQMLSSLIETTSWFAEAGLELIGVTNKQSDAIRDEQTEFNTLITMLQDVNLEEEVRSGIIDELNTKYVDYLGNLELEKATLIEIADAQRTANAEFLKKIEAAAMEEELQEYADKLARFYKLIGDTQRNYLNFLQQDGLDAALVKNIKAGVDAKLKGFRLGIQETLADRQEFMRLMGITDEEAKNLLGGGGTGGDGDDDSPGGKGKKPAAPPAIEIYGEIIDLGVKLYDEYLDEMTELRIAAISNSLERETAILEEWYAKEQETKLYKNSVEAKELIDKQYNNKKKQLKKEETKAAINLDSGYVNMAAQAATEIFGRNKAAALATAGINIAEAVTAALPNIPLAVAVGILGAIQVANIAATNYGYKRGGAFVGEDGVEIVAPVEDYAQGNARLITQTIMAVERSLTSGRSGSVNLANLETVFSSKLDQVITAFERKQFRLKGKDLKTSNDKYTKLRSELTF